MLDSPPEYSVIFMRKLRLSRFAFVWLCIASVANAETLTFVWDAPTTNVDGTPLTDLVGYRFYRGSTSNNYKAWADTKAIVTNFTLDEPNDGLFFYAVTAINSRGLESAYSNEVIVLVRQSTPRPAGRFQLLRRCTIAPRRAP